MKIIVDQRSGPRGRFRTEGRSLSAQVPINFDVMAGPPTRDDLGSAVSVEVAGDEILDSHASVIEDVPLETERTRSRLRVICVDARPSRGPAAFGVRVSLADEQLVVAVAVEVHAPDGVSPANGLVDHLTVPET